MADSAHVDDDLPGADAAPDCTATTASRTHGTGGYRRKPGRLDAAVPADAEAPPTWRKLTRMIPAAAERAPVFQEMVPHASDARFINPWRPKRSVRWCGDRPAAGIPSYQVAFLGK